MSRLLALLFALSLTLPVHATLAAIVPARDGLVIAADSRLTFMGAACDGAFKILIPGRPARTVVIVTGASVFVPPPPASPHNPCRYLATAPRLLDIGAVVTRTLQQQSDSENIDIAALTRACIRALAQFQSRYPAVLRTYAGRDIFSVVIAGYDRARATTTLRNFAVRLDAHTRKIEIGRDSESVLTPQNPRGIWIYGETEWLNRTVYAGPGRRLLTAATLRFLGARAPIAGTTRAQALAAARNILAAAIRTARSNPPPSGIGGAVHAVFIGVSPHPQPTR